MSSPWIFNATSISFGYAVPATASSGEEAIEKAAALRPDLVLMDIRLRGAIDGIEAAEEIRTRFNIPAVYLTAYADPATLSRARLTGALGYLIKPFGERELHAAVEVALYRHRLEQRVKESERWLAATLRSIADGVIATDAQGGIRFMNPVAERLTGWTAAQAAGRQTARRTQARIFPGGGRSRALGAGQHRAGGRADFKARNRNSG